MFFENTISVDHYRDILYCFIGQLTEKEISHANFQQDSAAAHTVHVSMVILCDVFGD